MSIHLIIIGPNRIIACSDDRTTRLGAGGVVTSTSENGPPKIFPAGKYSVCGAIGVTHAGTIRLKERLELLASDSSLADQPRKLLEAFRDDIHGPLFENFPPEWVRPEATTHLTAFALTRHPEGQIDLLELRFPLWNRELGEPEISGHMHGMPMFPRPIFPGHAIPLTYCRPLNQITVLAPSIQTDRDDGHILRSVDRVFQFIARKDAEFRQAVGGRIDVAAIDSAGFRWLRSPATAPVPETVSANATSKLDWGGSSVYNIHGDLTIGVWVKFSSNTAGTIISRGFNDGTNPTNFAYFLCPAANANGGWDVVYAHDYSTSSEEIHRFVTAITDDVWVFLLIVRDVSAKSVKLYIGYGDSLDLIDTWSYTNQPDGGGGASCRLLVGNSVGGSSATGDAQYAPFVGTVEEHYIYTRQLSQAEGEDAMKGNPSLTGMVLGSSMGDDPEVDFSATGAEGTVTGTTIVQGHA